MKHLEEFINEAKVVSVDPNLQIGLDTSKDPNEYNVTYTDAKGNIYKAQTSDFDMRRYAEVAAECIVGSREGIQKSWQDKLIKWVKNNKVS